MLATLELGNELRGGPGDRGSAQRPRRAAYERGGKGGAARAARRGRARGAEAAEARGCFAGRRAGVARRCGGTPAPEFFAARDLSCVDSLIVSRFS